MASKNNETNIDNAEELIDRFGGIRPMSTKIDVPVTTIQGWKKRGSIPGRRKKLILDAANKHGIKVLDLLAASSSNSSSSSSAGQASPPRKEDEFRRRPSQMQDMTSEENSAKRSEEMDIPNALKKSDSDDDDDDEIVKKYRPSSAYDIKNQIQKSENLAVWKSTAIGIVIILVITGLMVALLWPQAKKVDDNSKRIGGVQNDIAKIEGDLNTLKQDNSSFLGNLIPKDLEKRLTELQEQASSAQQQASAAFDKASEITADIYNSESLEERLTKLEKHVNEFTNSPELSALFLRVQELQNSGTGQEQIDQAISELGSVFSNIQSIPDLDNVDVNKALQSAREGSPILNETFKDVPAEDLKAAAMLIALSQFRSAVNRDGEPFEEDLKLLQKLVGEENVELKASIDRLAPHAQTGVLTATGLTNEFRTIAGDAAIASLKGEDVSFTERVTGRFNELFSVKKDGELVTGTETQKQIISAQTDLEEGNLASAIQKVEALDGPEADLLGPWLEKARASLNAQNVSDVLSKSIDFGSGAPGDIQINEDFLGIITGTKTIYHAPSGMVIIPKSNRGSGSVPGQGNSIPFTAR